MKFLIFFCLALCACASAAQAPDVGNHAPVGEVPTLERNMAATVMVHVIFWDSVDKTEEISSAPGVVVDDRHVLVITLENVTWFYTSWQLKEIRIGSISSDAASAPWKARVAASEDGFTVMETEESIPRPSVIISQSVPRADDFVYALDSTAEIDTQMRRARGMVVDHLEVERSAQTRHGIPMLFEILPFNDKKGWDPTMNALLGGIFNERHEMVGFGAKSPEGFRVRKKAQQRFFGGDYAYGASVPSISWSILPLLQKAGVHCTFP